ncbi:hypothetical protein [Aeoliella mucimassa]|nr:hypothetical protein [Aeoliella mucimassa]
MNSRYTFAAFMSFLLVLALASFSVAQPVASSDRSDQLQRLVNALGEQIALVRTRDERVADLRLKMLAYALDEWNASGRTDEDFAAMQTWLEKSIDSAMSGGRRRMPVVPMFSVPQVAEAVPAPSPASDEEPIKTFATEDTTPSEPAPAETAPSLPATTGPSLAAATPDEAATAVPSQPAERRDPSRQATPKKQTASIWQRHPAAQPIDLSDPFGDEGPAEPSSNESRVVMRPAAMSSLTPAKTRVEVNVMELGARVKGYIHGLRGVEARLLANDEMSADELLIVVRELRQLSNQRDLLSLYLETEALESSTQPTELPTVEHARRMINRRLEQLQEAGESDRKVLDATEAELIGV